MIISASRRTDIPAFYAPWFMDRIRERSIVVENPFNPSQKKRVSLSPEDVDVIVFWTRNAAPLFPYLDELEQSGYRFIVLYTITGYGPPLETECPAPEQALKTFQELTMRIGPRRVIWRFDPVIIADGQPDDILLSRFEQIAHALSGHTCRVIISFLDIYRKVARRLQALEKSTGLKIVDASAQPSTALRISRHLAAIAQSNHLTIRSCAEKTDLRTSGVQPGSCIDAVYLNALFQLALPTGKDKTQRPACRCAPSQDIGRYNTCRYGCVYCYAMR